MKKRILSTCIALTCVVLGAAAQRSYTFNAAALNVDGLPNSILGIEINPDGKEEAGATELCGILANSGWDIVGFSEDFNFHSNLVAAPASNYYNFGEHGGKVQSTSNSTDGLGFACAKRYTMSGGTRVKWSSLYGGSSLLTVGDNGADGMIDKGFRAYTVTLATGVAVDVYVLHMDANTADSDDDYDSNGRDKNVVAREDQLKQLADYIKNKHNNRPVIILGDTNCRYTREQVKTGFIDYINADSRFTIKDAWVELIWDGVYPTYGAGAMMTDAYGAQRGEVVDKVFYINTTESDLTLKANSYLHDTDVRVSDHYPVVVNFTLTDPNGKAPTATEKEDNWTLEEKAATFTKPTWEGEKVVSGTDYYLMNVATNECVRVGGAWYTQAVSGNAALKITPTTANGGTTWVLNTYRGCSLGTGDYAYTDQSGEWYLEQVEGTAYQYRLKNTGGTYLTATTTNEHPVRNMAGNASDDHQKWIFLTDARIRTEMSKANADYPFNFTALLKSADFDVIEYEDGWTAQGWTGFNQSSGPFKGTGHNWGGDALAYSAYAYANQAAEATMSQSLGTLPNGIYDISFTGFYRSQKSSGDETISAAVKFGSTSISVKQNKNVNIDDFVGAEQYFRVTNNTYRTSQQVTLSSSSSITLQVTKPKSSSSGWICVDNFRLLYYGTSAEAVDPYKEYKEQVRIKVNETYAKVIQLNDAGQAAYDITTVTSRYNNDQITTKEAADALCTMVDNAYANAYAAHRAYIVEDAFNNMGADGDVSAVIVNRSFETGDLTGWSVLGWGADISVQPNSNGTYTTSGCDGNYLFNSWNGDEGHGSHVKQTIKGIPNGLYELKASLASFSQTDGRTHNYHMYLFANGYNTSVEAKSNKGVFEEATLYFLVEDGTATIGAVGGNKGGGNKFIYYWPDEGCFLKADNFRLKYICDEPHGRLKLALNEANNAALDAYGKAALDLSSYEAKYNNKSLTTDGKTEAAAVYTALQTAAKAQRTKNADMTWAIENPSFETGDYKGWSTTAGWDTGVRTQESNIKVAGTNGRYLFNTWNDDNNVEETNRGVNAYITQTITDIPNGTYKVTAMLATNADKQLSLKANNKTTSIAASGNGESSGVFPEVTCEVTDGTLTIEAGGVDNVWYRCDDFRLTYLGHEGKFDEATGITADDWYTSVSVTRNMKAVDNDGNAAWNTFVMPIDMAIPEGWTVKALTGSELKNDNVTLFFTKAETIKAGVPYMVQVPADATSITATAENVQVNTVPANATTDHVEFVGVYKAGKVPTGAFFISSNTFYEAADETNTIKAFRAYIQPTVANARSISYRTDDETTDIGPSTLNAPSPVIYDLMGRKVTNMVKGNMYIVNGKKVVIK